MSTKYTGGFITKSPVAPTTTAASGIWTLDQQQQAQKAGTWPSPPIFIEDLFSTYLYTGNGSTQTITNGIDLAGEGGLVWIKSRSNALSHSLIDTVRGQNKILFSNLTDAQATSDPATGLTSFDTTGFSLGPSYTNGTNSNGVTNVSWTFREQPKFFDVVTYTGNGTSGRTVAHNLGSVPGCIIIKNTGTGGTNWGVYHRSVGATGALFLNQTYDVNTSSNYWNNTEPTSTVFTVGNQDWNNQSSESYVAYVFAHNAGGFPASGAGSTNGISCGSFTTDGSGNATINLGYEPQFLLQKSSSAIGNWFIADVMRGMTVSTTTPANLLRPNLANAESTGSPISPTPTGFIATNFVPSTTYIYIAIRRGPMKTPTVGTSVFSPNAVTMTGSGSATITTNFPVDLTLNRRRTSGDGYVMDRLRGGSQTTYNYLRTQTTAAESTGSGVGVGFDNNTDLVDNAWLSGVSVNTIWWNFRRAPGFFDEVCFTTPSSGTITINHNLGVTPQLVITKLRSGTTQFWIVNSASLASDRYLVLNTSAGSASAGSLFYTASASTVTYTDGYLNANSSYVQYLFATTAGVSKVGSYTGTGAAQTIDCGFTAGSRFVMIKRTDSTGDWYVWDSARGIIPSNDPYLLINSTAAEVTGTDYVDTTNVGFDITSTAPAEINANGGTYIFLAIA